MPVVASTLKQADRDLLWRIFQAGGSELLKAAGPPAALGTFTDGGGEGGTGGDDEAGGSWRIGAPPPLPPTRAT
jgi:hypothetical protein